MPSSATYTLQVNGSNVHVTLKRMKSIRLHVKPTGEVTLSAPLGTSKARISEFVRSKADWIGFSKQNRWTLQPLVPNEHRGKKSSNGAQW